MKRLVDYARALTVFLTTHNIEEASRMCDRIAIINRGKIAAIDTPEKLKSAMKTSQAVEIAFKEVKARIHKRLEALPSVREVQKRGDKLRLLTEEPSKTLKEVWHFIKENDLDPITLNTLGPSLEDVFLRLTGVEMEAEIIHKRKGRREAR